MRFLERISQKLRVSTAAALAAAPDPRVVNVTSQQKQRALLDQVGGAIDEVVAARGRLEASAAAVRDRLPALEAAARAELKAGRRGLARLALQRRQAALVELQTLERQLAEVEGEEAGLAAVQQRLSTQIEAFAARQQVIRARYSAAEAQVRISEAVTGVSADFADLTAALQRAEEKTQTMQARATAIDRLVEDGDLESLATSVTQLGSEVLARASDDDVDRQLAIMERALTEG